MRGRSVLRNAAAGIGDGEGRDLAAIGDVEADRARIGELDGVGEQVDEDLAQALLVGADILRQSACPLVFEDEPLGLGLRAEHVGDLVEKIMDVDLVRIDLQAAGLDLGNVEQPVDQTRQMVGAALDHLDRRLTRCRDGLVAFEDLGVAEHGVERRAQFMAEADDIAALGAVGGFRGFLGILQGRVGLLVGGDFLQQQRVLARGFLFRHQPAVMGQHIEPADDAGDDGKDEEDDADRAVDDRRGLAAMRVPVWWAIIARIDADAGDGQDDGNAVAPEAGGERFRDLLRQKGSWRRRRSAR